MVIQLFASELRELLDTERFEDLKQSCESAHPATIAEQLSKLEVDDALTVLKLIPLPLRSEVFSHFPEDLQSETVMKMTRSEIAQLMAEMAPDDRADLFNMMSQALRESVLPAMAHAQREDIRRLSSYEEGTAGSVMTSDYAILSPNITIEQAIERLRLEAPNTETIYYAYVVDEDRQLIGFISLKDLILARPQAKVSDIMQTDVIYAKVQDDQEDVARKIQKYDMIAIPVINGKNAMVGIITHDDAIDIISEEHTEDMEKFMAIAGSHEHGAYVKTSAWKHFKNRAGWVVALAVLGLVSGFIVQKFEGLLLHFTILAAFMPMLADTGGNTGSQASTLVVRALALKEISVKNYYLVLVKELKVALMLGLLLGVIAFGRVVLMGGGNNIPPHYTLGLIGCAIAVALSLQVITSTLIGAVLPLMASGLNLDPAVVASPALTTIVDITGLLIYFCTAKWILGI